MKRIIIFALLLMCAGLVSAQQYPLVTLQQINTVDPSLWSTFPPSPLANDTVRVRGVLTVRTVVDPSTNRHPIIWAGAAWSSYIQDPVNPIFGGLNVYQKDTVGTAQGTLFDLADTGKVYEFTGVVTPYFQSTELMLLTKTPLDTNPVAIQPISDLHKRPAPVQLLLDSLWTPGPTYNYAIRKYQGVYVQLTADDNHPLIVSDRVTGIGSASGNFKLNDQNGLFAYAYAQSSYFKSNANGIVTNYQPPNNGSYLAYVRGILTIRADAYYIVPLYPGDIGPVLKTPPTVGTVKRDKGTVAKGETVTVTAVAKGNSAAVSSMKLYFRINSGNLDSLTMTKSGTDTSLYSATIPAQNVDSAFVDYYVKGVDGLGLYNTSPANITNSRYSYFVLAPSKPLRIQHVRYSPFGSAYSSYNGYSVTVSGVVNSDTTDIPGNHGSNPPRLYMQDGNGPWSGLMLGTVGNIGTQVLTLKSGDLITVTGVVTLTSGFGNKIDTISALNVVSHGNALPAAVKLYPWEVGTSTLGVLSAEKWHGMLVRYDSLRVDSANADGTSNFGESYVNNGILPHTRVIWSDGATHFNNAAGTTVQNVVKKNDFFGSITGILGYTHSYYKLCPRKDADIVNYKPLSVEQISGIAPKNFNLQQNYPNPFNPSTTIKYDVKNAGVVTLKIYNTLGQEVKTLVNQMQSAGTYSVTFNASSMPSGMYIYTIHSNGISISKKMMLIK
ncbi:MAG: T9SS type A sorting domain-containing protein [Ignavibacteria bacterium]|nr:T9SS type A sorting domain-containing protein [Ignavibacteria bacterium]